MVVTVTPTIGSGTVVRWYPSMAAYDYGHPTLSASRDGVMIHGDVFLHDLPAGWIDAARDAHEAIKAGRDVKHLATHRSKGLFGPLVPVEATL